MGLVASVRHNLANLTNFAGRESRAQFWPYAVVVFVLAMAVHMGLVAPAIIETQRQFCAHHEHTRGPLGNTAW